jgi:hypothetical protein
MTTNMVCTFCKNKGIPSPHNHTVRNWTLSDKPVICPVLLATECTYCKTKGHTRQYCPIRNTIKNINNDNDKNNNCDLKRLNNNPNINTKNKQQKII